HALRVCGIRMALPSRGDHLELRPGLSLFDGSRGVCLLGEIVMPVAMQSVCSRIQDSRWDAGNRIGSDAPIRYANACRVGAQRWKHAALLERWRRALVLSCNPCTRNLL